MARRRRIGTALAAQNTSQVLSMLLQNRLMQQRQAQLRDIIGEQAKEAREAGRETSLLSELSGLSTAVGTGTRDPESAAAQQEGLLDMLGPNFARFTRDFTAMQPPVRRRVGDIGKEFESTPVNIPEDVEGFTSAEFRRRGVEPTSVTQLEHPDLGPIGAVETDVRPEFQAIVDSLTARRGAGVQNITPSIYDDVDPTDPVGTPRRRLLRPQDVPVGGLTMQGGATPEQTATRAFRERETDITMGGPTQRGEIVKTETLTGPESLPVQQAEARGSALTAGATEDAKMTPGRVQARVSEAGQTAGAQDRAKSEANPKQTKYIVDSATRTIEAIDGVLPDITALTAGLGSLLSWIPGTAAANTSAELSAVASNVAFAALTAMRAASASGGALGQVSDKEIDFLQSVEGSLRQDQSPANLRAQLTRVRESMQRLKEAANLQALPSPSGAPAIRVLSIEEVP